MTDAITAKLALRFGPGVAEWTAGLPALVHGLARRWRLEVGTPYDGGASSVAIRVRTADDRPAVLKLSPDTPFLAEQATVLRLFAPSGRVPAVLADEPGALLMEAIEPGTELDEAPTPPTAAAYAELLADLHSVDPPEPEALGRSLRGRVEEFVHRAARQLTDPALSRVHRSDFERVTQELDGLLATTRRTVLLHGDLHLGNVLDGGPTRGMVAIDPKACLGDPCFDAVDYVVAGAGRADGIEYRLTELAAATGLDRDRLYAWSRLVAAITAISLLRAGNREPAVTELLALAR